MHFGVLGPLSVIGSTGEPIVIVPPQQRTILRVLLARANHAVPADTLATALWEEGSGQRSAGALRVLIHHVRRAIGADRIVRDPDGYVLSLAPGEGDAQEFIRLVEHAGALTLARKFDETRRTLRQALNLWRGPAFEDDDSCDLVRTAAARLNDRRMTAYEDLFDLEIDHGRHREICAELLAIVRDHPLQEQFVAQAMTALAGSGREAEALMLYDRTRRLLGEELGVDPGIRLRELHRHLLTPTPPAPNPAPAPVPVPVPVPAPAPAPAPAPVPAPAPAVVSAPVSAPAHAVPAQLPPLPAHFTARQQEVEMLCDRLRADTNGPALAGIAGMGGIGKTTLAVKVGHRLAAEFPDGQLFVDLAGSAPEPADPGRVLGAFLRALGMTAAAIPDGTEERAALFRTRLANRRVLVVLDNAASATQIRPLLPAGGGSAALVTSRSRVAALDGFHWTDLGLLSRADGTRLLQAVAGADHDGADEAAEVVALCGRLPLAIRIAGARLVGRPHWTFARLAGALQAEQSRLDELAVDDLAVRGSLHLSYQALPADAARLFRRLGLLDSGDWNAWVAATLLDTSVATAERLVDQLIDAQLLSVTGTGPGPHFRYRLHDLVRIYAREQAYEAELETDRDTALARVWAALVEIATEADRRSPLRILAAVSTLTGAAAPVHPWIDELLPDPAAWFDAELTMVIWAARAASTDSCSAPAWQVPAASLLAFQPRGLFQEWRETHQLGLSAARMAGDSRGQAVLHRNLAHLEIFGGGGDCHRGAAEAEQALALFRSTGDRLGEVDALFLRSAAHLRLGELAKALPDAQEALRLARATGDRRAEANLLHHVGWVHRMSGDLYTALSHLDEGVRLADEGNYLRLRIWLSLAVGIVHRERNDLAAAELHLRQALDAARTARTEGDIASILNNLAALQRRRGNIAGAQTTAEEGLQASRAVGLAFAEGDALITLGEIANDAGDGERAYALLADGRDRMVRLASAYGSARAWKALGTAEDLNGRPGAARAARHEARSLYLKAGNAAEAEALDALLDE
ncbi:AfsR/SARP family transcriptional regulator [Actinoplanes sp. NPDC051859]|uniref:AfsR/SARP family transcriptional regulator n=1 Tax=Actinoplanes sp. NPDC051859 TaxID=3363909 RepID=UPI0037943C81